MATTYPTRPMFTTFVRTLRPGMRLPLVQDASYIGVPAGTLVEIIDTEVGYQVPAEDYATASGEGGFLVRTPDGRKVLLTRLYLLPAPEPGDPDYNDWYPYLS